MDERQVLKNLFEPRGEITWYGTVIERVALGHYRVQEDGTDKIETVDCDPGDFYPPEAPVIVQDGRITGSAQLSGEHKIYEV